MEEVLERFDSRRGIVGFLVVVSLLAGFIVVSNEVRSGNPNSLLYFLLFVVVLVGAVIGGSYGWRHVE